MTRGRWTALFLRALSFAAVLGLAAFPSGMKAKGGARVHGGGHGGGSTGRAWRVMPPVSYKNLTLFPIAGGSTAAATDAYITLDEGIRNGTVIISEKGSRQEARQTSRRAALNQRVAMESSGGDSVNELSLINRSGKKLLLLSGEVIVGGKQDRIVEEDLIVPPVSVPVSLNVFCVEHGRWSQRTARATGGTSNRAERGIAAPAPIAPGNFSSLGAISHPKLRAAAQDKKQQGEVWKEVNENNVRLGTANTTDTYQEVYTSKKVGATMEQYISALHKEVLAPNVVGVVVARNGELVWVDAFASPALFAKYWPKLLKSYVVDAMSEQRSETRPTVEEAQRYLSEGGGKVVAAGKDGVYRLLKTEHASYAVFRLEDISLSAPFLLHFNKMQR